MDDLIDQESQKDTFFRHFLHSQTASGLVLLVVSGFAFYLANSHFWETYNLISHTHFSLSIADWQLDLDLNHWVNEGLMVLFFFLVGLEIKREILVGELSNPRKASLAVFAALGGMIVPALIYGLYNILSPETRGGWGVPMATDIAFAIGVLSLLGKRVPVSLKVFLTCLAIVDDLGAILVIAVFYTEEFALNPLLLSLGFVGMSVFYARVMNGSRGPVYALFCIGCWYFILQSGIHSTIAGVMMAFTIPIRRKYDLGEVNQEFKESFGEEDFDLKEHHLEALERVIRNTESPLYRFEHNLHPWVAFGIMPLFAFFNAGVHLPTHFNFSLMLQPHVLGIFFGLVLGKPMGVLLACRFAVARGWASLPTGVGWKAMIGISQLAGLGFTMSLFISVLAFEEGSANLEEAKLGILLASITAMLIGAPMTWIGLSKKNRPVPPLIPTLFMKQPFWKMHGAGNDFVLIDDREQTFPDDDHALINRLATPKYGIGSEGIILIQPSETADFRMRFYNPDGNEVEMCGNGARCVARLANEIGAAPKEMAFDTVAGVIKASLLDDGQVRLTMTPPTDWKLQAELALQDQSLPYHFVNSGVPHVVIEVEDLANADLLSIGPAVRYHEAFQPAGTNVNLISVTGPTSLSVRTYERGVEAETLACGTGIVACGLIAGSLGKVSTPVEITCASGDVLRVDYTPTENGAENVTLTGAAEHVFRGEIEV